MKRTIRLKELEPGTETWHTPAPEYLARTDGSLPAEPYHCRVDNDGFLVTGNPSSSLPPLVFMGDSFVESMYTHEQDRFVSVVERGLTDFRCLNASYSGSTTLQLFNNLINKIYPIGGPGTPVIIFPPHSDTEHIYEPGSYWNQSKRAATVLPPAVTANGALASGAEVLRSMLTLWVASALELGMRPILATTPFRVAPFGEDAALRAIWKRNSDLYHQSLERRIACVQAVRDVARLTGVDLIDAEAFLGGNPDYFFDELHLNPAGQSHFADFLTDELRRILR